MGAVVTKTLSVEGYSGGQVPEGGDQSQQLRPFVRWAGSKQRLLKFILPHIPNTYKTYYEPFLGSGALFFALTPDRAELGDHCSELIAAYRAVRDEVGAVIQYLEPLKQDRKEYYRVRANRSKGKYKRAAEFIYLNKSCWNGLYRVNLRGEFNVPYGLPKGERVFDRDHLHLCAAALGKHGVRLCSGDFEAIVAGAGRGDFVYFDPPYVTRHNNNGFIEWNERIFSWGDQLRLAKLAQRLKTKGAHVIVSNADHADVIALYPDFRSIRIVRSSTLASNPAKRTTTSEILLVG